MVSDAPEAVGTVWPLTRDAPTGPLPWAERRGKCAEHGHRGTGASAQL